MKIAILSRGPKLYSTQRLKQAAKERGHTVRVLDTLQFSIIVEKGNPTLLYKNKKLDSYDAVIPRIGNSITFFGTAVVRQFEQMGVFCLNSATSISASRDKLRAVQVLSSHHIGMPTTAFVKQQASVMPVIERVGGAPVIIKLLEGTQGIGVILAETSKVAEAIVETLQSTRQNVLIQNFVKESKGSDVRAFVAGGKVIAAMRRRAQGEEFRSNVHRGGNVELVKLSDDYERTAIQAAQILGLRVAGVDMLEGGDGPKVMEVNSSPGLEGIERATQIDIASKIIEHIEEQVSFPDIDLRQRLTLAQGYGVTEFRVPKTSMLCNKTLQEAGLRELDVLVLSMKRHGETIPNPRGSRDIQAGDLLLCYGRQDVLREFMPMPKRKKRKKKESDKSFADSLPEGVEEQPDARPDAFGQARDPISGELL